MVTDFEERFDDIMRYVEVRLRKDGQSKNIKNKEDLKALFKRLDETRRDKEGSPRLSNRFIDGLVHTRKAESMMGHRVGRRRETGVYRERYKSGNRTVYKGTIKRNHKLVVVFRDEKGRFVKKDTVRDSEE